MCTFSVKTIRMGYTYISLSSFGCVPLAERLIAVTKPYETGKPDSLIVIVPSEIRKLLKIKKGEKLAVKIDERGRIIYERIQEEKAPP